MDLKVCPRCICMHMKLVDDALLQRSESDIKDSVCARWPHVTKSLCEIIINTEAIDICYSCLGILQDNFLKSFTETVTQVFKKDNYECQNFQLGISLPVQLTLFIENAGNILEETLSDVRFSGRGYTAKEIVKVFVEPHLEKSLSLPAVSKEVVDLEISVLLKHSISETDLLPKIAVMFPLIFGKTQNQHNNLTKKKAKVNLSPFNSTTIANVMRSLSPDDLSGLMDMSYFKNSIEIDCVKLLRAPIFLGGRYKKYSRELSQTPWILDGERKSEMSVQEFITLPIKKLLGADGCNFASSGREDVDVRMLGNGRPFLIEVINSRTSPSADDVVTLEKDINGSTESIQIQDLQSVGKEDAKLLKDGEEEKTKSYSAMCYTELSSDITREKLLEKFQELSKKTNVKIKQKTPIRVLHRRNLAVREREIYSFNISVVSNEEAEKLESINSKLLDKNVVFKLEITTQAGTYVKEFVHGDFGRTTPNMMSLMGAKTDILSLDVTAVNLEWPRKC